LPAAVTSISLMAMRPTARALTFLLAYAFAAPGLHIPGLLMGTALITVTTSVFSDIISPTRTALS
jgi:hypothetical protein